MCDSMRCDVATSRVDDTEDMARNRAVKENCGGCKNKCPGEHQNRTSLELSEPRGILGFACLSA